MPNIRRHILSGDERELRRLLDIISNDSGNEPQLIRMHILVIPEDKVKYFQKVIQRKMDKTIMRQIIIVPENDCNLLIG